MSNLLESVKTFNSLIRTALAVGVVGLGSAAAYWGYQVINADDIAREELADAHAELAAKDQEIADVRTRLDTVRSELDSANQTVATQKQKISDLNVAIEEKDAVIAEQEVEIERLDTAMRLLKVDKRLAYLTVVDQDNDPETGELFSIVEFVEVDQDGRPIEEPKQYRLRGDIIYIDAKVVKFEDKYIEQADLHRSTTIYLFQRIFDEIGGPQEGYALDPAGRRPSVYGRGGKMSDYEQRIWGDFWNIANNPKKAKELGIRAAHGEATFMKVRKGKRYPLQLRASDGLTFTPGEDVKLDGPMS